MTVLLICLVCAGAGVLLMWPSYPAEEGTWWIGPGTRHSRAGRIRLLVGDVLLVGGLLAALIVEVIDFPPSSFEVAVLVVQAGLLTAAVVQMVRHLRAHRVGPSSSGPRRT
jgi:hypothetical protein